MRKIVALAVAAVALAAGAAEAQTPDSRAIFQSWIGRTLDSEGANGQKIVALFSADGTARVTGAVDDKGTWRLDAEGYCATWAKLRDGKERCFTILPMGASFLIVVRNTNDVIGKVTPR